MRLHGRAILGGGAALLILGWLLLPPLAKTGEPGQNNNRDDIVRPSLGVRVPLHAAIEAIQINPARVLHAVPGYSRRTLAIQGRQARAARRHQPKQGRDRQLRVADRHEAEHVALAAQIGVTTIRCGIEQGSLEDLAHPGKYSEEGFARIERFFRWCGECHIQCIFDLHWPFAWDDHGRSFWDSQELQQRWCAVWQEIARRFHANPQVLAYEPYNEPGPPYANRYHRWNELAKRITAAIRQVDSVKPIIIDCIYWHPREFGGLEPTGDANAWYSFHYYEPLPFHCQKRPWNTDQKVYHYPGEFPGGWWNLAMILQQWRAALDFAEKRHVPLFVGEFGCVHEVPEMEDAVWLLDMVSLFDTQNIGWTQYFFMSDAIHPYWQEHFDCGMYIYDAPHHRVRCFDRKVSLMSDLMKLRGSVLDVPQPTDEWITAYAVAEPTGETRVYLSNKSRDQAKTIRLHLAGRTGVGRAKCQQMKRGSNGFFAAGDVALADGTLEVSMAPLTIHRLRISR